MECLNDVKGEWESVFQPIPLIHSDPLFATSGVDLYALGESQASLTVSQQHTRLQGDNSVWLLTEKITMSKCFKMSLLLREKKRRTAFSFQHVVWSFVCAFNFILNIFLRCRLSEYVRLLLLLQVVKRNLLAAIFQTFLVKCSTGWSKKTS